MRGRCVFAELKGSLQKINKSKCHSDVLKTGRKKEKKFLRKQTFIERKEDVAFPGIEEGLQQKNKNGDLKTDYVGAGTTFGTPGLCFCPLTDQAGP